MLVSLIVATDLKNGIGLDNKLLCHLPADLKYFKSITTGHHVLMGRKTYESIGKPLPNRTNLILSRSVAQIDGCKVFEHILDAVSFAKENNETELFIIGGDSIYKQAIHFAHKIYLTRILHTFFADAFFPELNGSDWDLVSEQCHKADDKNKFDHCFQTYTRQI